MKLFKNIGIIFFIIITILFTVGWATQPLVKIKISSNTGSTTTTTTTIDFYMNDIKTTFTGNPGTPDNNISSASNYNDVISNKIMKALFYLAISGTCLLCLGIIISILGLFGFVFLSKIIFFLAMIVIIIVFLIVQFGILAENLMKNVRDLSSVSGDRKSTRLNSSH